MTTYLPDINVWIGLAFESHFHHPAASRWLDDIDDPVCFCRVTQHGFLRLATNPSAVGEDVVTLEAAWRFYDEFNVDSRITFADEPSGLENGWRSRTVLKTFSNKVWTDAYLAAFASASDFGLVTFDKGFRQYNDLRLTMLT